MFASASRAAACSEAFLLGPEPRPSSSISHHRHGREQTLVRRPRGIGQAHTLQMPPDVQVVPGAPSCGPRGVAARNRRGRRTGRQRPRRSRSKPLLRNTAPMTASTVAATTLCDRIRASISSAPTRSPSRARSTSSPSSRARPRHNWYATPPGRAPSPGRPQIDPGSAGTGASAIASPSTLSPRNSSRSYDVSRRSTHDAWVNATRRASSGKRRDQSPERRPRAVSCGW